ncbi:uncharacterized protein [Miscanthus floridulus]|uniref:uncharacterized protein n=1 Tax=Miscanthus floridulus TaxID=154761 RepID=UPI00345A121E
MRGRGSGGGRTRSLPRRDSPAARSLRGVAAANGGGASARLPLTQRRGPRARCAAWQQRRRVLSNDPDADQRGKRASMSGVAAAAAHSLACPPTRQARPRARMRGVAAANGGGASARLPLTQRRGQRALACAAVAAAAARARLASSQAGGARAARGGPRRRGLAGAELSVLASSARGAAEPAWGAARCHSLAVAELYVVSSPE